MAEPRPPKGFPLFPALRRASPDTIILLIVTIMQPLGGGGGQIQNSRTSPLRTPMLVMVMATAREENGEFCEAVAPATRPVSY